MRGYMNVLSVVVLLVVVGFASGSWADEKKGLIRDGLQAGKFDGLSVDEKKDVLAGIAESSYKILEGVPEHGLRDSRDSIKQVIEARKWLEDTNDLVSWMLALRVQYAVDSCILNEMYRTEKTRMGQPVYVKFKEGSFNHGLATALLKGNELDERKWIGFAMRLDTKIGKFYRQKKYGPGDFLTGRVFEEADDKMTVSFELTLRSLGKIVGKKTQRISARGMPSNGFLLIRAYVESRENAEKAILPMVLSAIDDARDARVVARVYGKHGGFVDTIKPGRTIAESKGFKDRVEKEFSNEGKGHLTKRATGICGTIRKRVESGEPPGSYIKRLRLDLIVCVRDVSIFPARYQRGATRTGLVGPWLELVE